MDIFFVGDQEAETGESSEPQQIPKVSPDVITEAFPQDITQASSKSIQEQLQEVDFYIRLGFNEEALAKLNEIARSNPGNPELAFRYKKLGAVEQAAAQEPEAIDKSEMPVFSKFEEANLPEGIDASGASNADRVPGGFAIVDPGDVPGRQDPEPLAAASLPAAAPGANRSPEAPRIQTVIPLESDKSGFQANEMFADLMDEVGAAADQEVSLESFEDHFSLGTAYREMDLIDEAIREFQSALKVADAQKNSQQIIQCCGMRWCQTGLNIADISSHEAMALRYDMGIAHSMSGSRERALECFNRLFGMDPSYRDVAQRIDELKSGSNRHAP
jgi:tetratricopeptide (TPR) repeat protein